MLMISLMIVTTIGGLNSRDNENRILSNQQPTFSNQYQIRSLREQRSLAGIMALKSARDKHSESTFKYTFLQQTVKFRKIVHVHAQADEKIATELGRRYSDGTFAE